MWSRSNNRENETIADPIVSHMVVYQQTKPWCQIPEKRLSTDAVCGSHMVNCSTTVMLTEKLSRKEIGSNGSRYTHFPAYKLVWEHPTQSCIMINLNPPKTILANLPLKGKSMTQQAFSVLPQFPSSGKASKHSRFRVSCGNNITNT